jgi:glycosyltransferase involved in cell wall biosynthesis
MRSPGERAAVSCIVPVFNGEAFLAAAVRTVLSQTHQPIEIIVVDDGSTDDTGVVARSLGDRVRCIRRDNALAGRRGPAPE